MTEPWSTLILDPTADGGPALFMEALEARALAIWNRKEWVEPPKTIQVAYKTRAEVIGEPMLDMIATLTVREAANGPVVTHIGYQRSNQ